jgi:Fur family transcriptional regulator, ferric uptake regulator
MSIAAERQQFRDYLRSHGHRVTSERLEVFEEIYAQHGHVDAERLLDSLRRRGAKVSRATVYRNLELMVACGLVRKSRLGGGGHVYEHLHAGQEHDHLVCGGCGRVVEFVSPGITALQAEICRAHGFVPGRHTLQIQGLCNRCATGAS